MTEPGPHEERSARAWDLDHLERQMREYATSLRAAHAVDPKTPIVVHLPPHLPPETRRELLRRLADVNVTDASEWSASTTRERLIVAATILIIVGTIIAVAALVWPV